MMTAAPLPADGMSSTRVPATPPKHIGIPTHHPKAESGTGSSDRGAGRLRLLDLDRSAWDEPEALGAISTSSDHHAGQRRTICAARLGSERRTIWASSWGVSFLAEVHERLYKPWTRCWREVWISALLLDVRYRAASE
jgi:hypothetical protein